jgi:hypothetical protein
LMHKQSHRAFHRASASRIASRSDRSGRATLQAGDLILYSVL